MIICSRNSIWLYLGFIYFCFFLGFKTFAQTQYAYDSISIIQRLKADITILASDSLQGREAGTEGEKMARDYIVKQFRDIGLIPFINDSTYIQAFPFSQRSFNYRIEQLKLGEKPIKNNYFNYFPDKDSVLIEGNTKIIHPKIFCSKSNEHLKHDGLAEKIAIIDIQLIEKLHKKLCQKAPSFSEIIKILSNDGVKAVVFINAKEKLYWTYLAQFDQESLSVPVFLINKKQSKLFKSNQEQHFSFSAKTYKVFKNAYNIVGYINNNATKSIVIGAHYDHIGVKYTNNKNKSNVEVNNGADDNASGTAAMMELARIIKNRGNKTHNYIFAAFSAEEKGLIGSSYLLKSGVLKPEQLMCMLNLDMVGRLDLSKRQLGIIGTGTSPIWDTLLENTPHPAFKLKLTSSGMGSSDHSSFYLRQVPALFFFTGIHADYHKPTDDVDKINFGSMVSIIKYIDNVILKLENIDYLPFKKTNDTATRVNMTGVTLGVMPDHSFDGKGMRIEAVVPGKTADKNDFKAGDIIIKIGNTEILDIVTYMKALNALKKGDTVNIHIKRNEEEINKEVTF